MDARQVWQAALERIQERVSRGAYTTWFRGSFGVELSQRVLVVAVSNSFTAEHLSQRFADVARSVVSQALGAPAEVRFVPGGRRVLRDTTGAGDAHAAGLLAGLTRGFDLFAATAFANEVARRQVMGQGLPGRDAE